MMLIANYKSTVTENRRLGLVLFETVIKAHAAEYGYGSVK